jgi:polar amino acid transport system substrate-binding protein
MSFKVSSIAAVSAAILLLSACSANSSTTSAPSASATSATSTAAAVSADPALVKLLPAAYKTKGLTAGSEIPYAPMEFYDSNNKPVGFEIDLLNAIAAKLGTTVTFQKQSFDTLIPSLQAGNHDLAVSSMSDTVERQKALDFVDYFQGGASLIVLKGNPAKVTGLAGLCGKTVTTESASWEVDVLKTASQACTKAGKSAITTLALPSDVEAQNAVRAQNAVAYLSDSQAAAYTAKVAGNGSYFDLIVDPTAPNGYESGLIGVGILKKNADLTKAIQAAVASLIKDGNYAQLLKNWNLSSFAVTSATINGTK